MSITQKPLPASCSDRVRRQQRSQSWIGLPIVIETDSKTLCLPAFLIACIVSFRTLFVQRSNKAIDECQKKMRREAAHRSAMRRGWRAKARRFHESVLETCKTLEDWSDSDETLALRSLPGVPSGLMTVDFNDDGNWSRGATRDGTIHAKSSLEGPVSTHVVLKTSDSTTNA